MASSRRRAPELCLGPRAISNYQSSIRKYLRFWIEAINPSYQELCAYIEFLADSTPPPQTVSNHVSHVRTYLRKAQVSTQEADNGRVKWALYALSKTYIPRIKSAFPILMIQWMVQRMVRALPFSAVRTSNVQQFFSCTTKHCASQRCCYILSSPTIHVSISPGWTLCYKMIPLWYS